ncbi:MAG: hypothetical protein Q9192_005673 [Flavoplaca navasiana]
MCTAIQVALVELLRHWNVTPTAVVGHSSGEIAAAFAKGSITREMAWTIAYHRGRLSQAINGLAPGLSDMRTIDTQRSVLQDGANEEGSQLHLQLAQAENAGTATDLVTGALKKKLAKAMMMAVEDIDGEQPVSSYGVDSLVAVEVRTWVFKEIKADISVFDVLSNVPLTTLARTIVGRSKYVNEAVMEAES